MSEIKTRAYARAGLLGNPSDGYNGKTISFAFRNFWAEVTLVTADQISIEPNPEERLQYSSLEQVAKHIEEQGYYGGVRLIKAALKRFQEYRTLTGQLNPADNFSIRYQSNIPRQVGLAGSSAIVTATLQGLMQWFSVKIPPHELASLTLSSEHELRIPAGLQDRVIQAYGGLVFMDFSKQQMMSNNGLEFGKYLPLNVSQLPNVYVAYSKGASEPTETLHNDLRGRFEKQDSAVTSAMTQFADLAQQGLAALENRDASELAELIDANFDLRKSICNLHPEHVQMIETARSVGASAKYCGSGGAIVGTFKDDAMYEKLRNQLSAIGCEVVIPEIE